MAHLSDLQLRMQAFGPPGGMVLSDRPDVQRQLAPLPQADQKAQKEFKRVAPNAHEWQPAEGASRNARKKYYQRMRRKAQGASGDGGPTAPVAAAPVAVVAAAQVAAALPVAVAAPAEVAALRYQPEFSFGNAAAQLASPILLKCVMESGMGGLIDLDWACNDMVSRLSKSGVPMVPSFGKGEVDKKLELEFCRYKLAIEVIRLLLVTMQRFPQGSFKKNLAGLLEVELQSYKQKLYPQKYGRDVVDSLKRDIEDALTLASAHKGDAHEAKAGEADDGGELSNEESEFASFYPRFVVEHLWLEGKPVKEVVGRVGNAIINFCKKVMSQQNAHVGMACVQTAVSVFKERDLRPGRDLYALLLEARVLTSLQGVLGHKMPELSQLIVKRCIDIENEMGPAERSFLVEYPGKREDVVQLLDQAKALLQIDLLEIDLRCPLLKS